MQYVKRKKMMLVLLLAALLCTFGLLHKVYAGKPVISLNSPVSFPVDI